MRAVLGAALHVPSAPTCAASGDVLWRRYVAAGRPATAQMPTSARGGGDDPVFEQGPAALASHRSLITTRPALLAADAKIVPAAPMSDHSGGVQRQRRRGVTVDVELDAAMALADMAGVGPGAPPAGQVPPLQQGPQLEVAEHDDEELASTRLSLELGGVGIQSSSCSSSSSAGLPAQRAPLAVAATGYGPRPRHMLTEAEKEAKRLRRMLANRESARQTILRRQTIRDELARRVADLSSENESMKKEKETVMQAYLSLKETNKQLKEQAHHLSFSLF